MRVERAELIVVDMPLVRPFRTAHGVSSVERKLLVRVHTDLGTGWGECAAMAEPLYSSEYVDGARHVLMTQLLPRFASADVAFDGVAELLAPVQGHRMAKAAIELGVLDAWGRACGQSLAALLGSTAPTVPSGVAVSDSVCATLVSTPIRAPPSSTRR
jgi:O-succinylbenzoate synthase